MYHNYCKSNFSSFLFLSCDHQCESDELKALIQRVLELEKYVKDKQNQTKPASSQGANPPTPQPSKAAAASQAPSSGQSQPASATAAPSGSTQKPYTSPPQPPKPAALPASSPVPASAQGQPPPFTSVPAGSPQVIWSNPAPPPVSPPLPSPFGVTIQSTLEAPGTVLGGTGQVDIQVRKLGWPIPWTLCNFTSSLKLLLIFPKKSLLNFHIEIKKRKGKNYLVRLYKLQDRREMLGFFHFSSRKLLRISFTD